MMKKYLFCVAILASGLTARAQETVYVCQGQTYQAIAVTSVGDITFSADGSVVNIGTNGSFKTADVDSITFALPTFATKAGEKEILVAYSCSNATVTMGSAVKAVKSTVSGANVTLSSSTDDTEYTYKVFGNTDDGSLLIKGDYKLTLNLSGCSITSTTGAALNVDCGKRIAIIIEDGTTNTFVDSSNGSQKGCFVVDGHVEFEGGGTLNITGNTNHAMKIGEYLEFKKTTGAINILKAVSDGIHCGKGKVNNANNYFEMKGGVLTVKNVGSDCVDSDDYGVIKIKGGTLDLTVPKDGKGLKCDSTFTMTDGTINFTCAEDLANGIKTNYNGFFNGGTITGTVSGNGAKGINGNKSGSGDPVQGGGCLYFNGTNVTLTVSGGNYEEGAETTKCHGIRAEQIFTQTDGVINITVTNTDAKGVSATMQNLKGGTLNVISSSGVNAVSAGGDF